MKDFDDFFKEFDELFREEIRRMRKFLTAISNIPEDQINERIKRGEPLTFGFTYSWRTGMPTPQIRYFGNIKPERPIGIKVDDEVTPFYDIYEKDDVYEVIIELPGAEKKDVELSIKGNDLEVKAKTKYKKYNTVIRLPSEVSSEDVIAKMNNGVLTVTLKRKEKEGKKIKILD